MLRVTFLSKIDSHVWDFYKFSLYMPYTPYVYWPAERACPVSLMSLNERVASWRSSLWMRSMHTPMAVSISFLWSMQRQYCWRWPSSPGRSSDIDAESFVHPWCSPSVCRFRRSVSSHLSFKVQMMNETLGRPFSVLLCVCVCYSTLGFCNMYIMLVCLCMQEKQ